MGSRQEWSRRDFLKLTGAALSTVLLPEFLPNGVLAMGVYLVPGPNGEEVGKWAEIVGTRGYQYLVNTIKGEKLVPLENLKLLDGWPFSIAHIDNLGFRNDAHWLMEWASRLGSSMVRINAPPETIEYNSDVGLAIRTANAFQQKTLAVFNPKELYGEEWLRTKVKYLTQTASAIEIGNEPDNQVVQMWKEQNMTSFARMVHVVQDEATRNRFAGPLVLGALVDVDNEPKMLEALVREGVDVGRLRIGLHAYQSSDQVWSRFMKLRNHLKSFGLDKAKIWITEIGVNYADKHSLMGLIETGWRVGAEMTIVHELPKWQSTDGSWGLVDPYLETATPMIFDFSAWSREVSETNVNPVENKNVPSSQMKNESTPRPTTHRPNKGESD